MRLKKVEDMVVESLDSKWEKLPADLGSHEAGNTNGSSDHQPNRCFRLAPIPFLDFVIMIV
jgi:hypothetical protein